MSLCTTSSQEVKRAGRVVCDGNLRLIEALRIGILQLKDLPLRTSRNPQRISMTVSLDTEKIHETAASASNSICNINDDFAYEITNNFSKLHITICEEGRIPRLIGRLSLKKREIIKNSGKAFWYHLAPVTKENDISEQLNVDIQYDKDTSRLSLKVLNYAGLNVSGPFYLVVTLQGVKKDGSFKFKDEAPKLKIGQRKDGLQDREEKLVIDCADWKSVDNTIPQLRMSLWRQVANSPNSEFYGVVSVPLDASVFCSGPQWYWYSLKPYESSKEHENSRNEGTAKLGQIYLRLYYTADHILPLKVYQPLFSHLTNSLSFYPFCSSLVGILEYLPSIDLTCVARTLMKIFINAGELSSLIKLFGTQDIQNCSDVNTLFRSQSMTSKIIYEEMKFLGQNYLLSSLKRVIDQIYSEKKCCEVDPAKLKSGDNLEQNTYNLIFYGELAFKDMVESFEKCPDLLRRTFAVLRELVTQQYPNRNDLQRLVISSFIVLRFFTAALMNPKLFGLKGELPDPMTSRTLVLVSKILQRSSNSAVSERVLNSKEPWLASVLQRFTDEQHRQAMLKFLDGISLKDYNLKATDNVISGIFIQRRPKRKIFTNLVHQKRRYVALTEKELWWKKTADDKKKKGEIELHEITRIEPVRNVKNVFRIATSNCELLLQAKDSSEMNEWLVQLQLRTQVKKERDERSDNEQNSDSASSCLLNSLDDFSLYDIDTERELETLHLTLYENAETLKVWKNVLEGIEVPAGQPHLPDGVLEQVHEVVY
uniref:Ras-GAP domain-containing protein n=1 Tax=Syphacia muris TaxID=451379 RepID=A0A0N5AT75_9BILA